MNHERAGVRVCARESRNDTAATGNGFDEGGLVSGILETALYVARRPRFTIADRPWLGGVDAFYSDESLDLCERLCLKERW